MQVRVLFFLSFLFFFTSCGSKKTIIEKSLEVRKKTYNYHQAKNKKPLKLDFYKSRVNNSNKPLIIYVHGGGFSGGKRDDLYIQRFCKEMTKNGFSVASISYRLTMKNKGFGCNTPSSLKLKAFDDASEDISYATRYLIKNSKKFKINPNQIVLVGSSAGAEAVLNLLYEYNQKILPKDFKFAGAITMAGAVTSLDNITTKTAVPTLFFHGMLDKLVPYDFAPHHYCKPTSKGFLPLYGSKAIATKLREINSSYYLFSIKDGTHAWNSKPMYFCIPEILDFLRKDVLLKTKRQKEVVKKKSNYVYKET